MTSARTILAAAIASGALLAAGHAAAQGYIGGAIGQGRINVDCDGVANCDKTGTGFKLGGGYRFHPNLAVEANYFDFGKARASDEELSASLKGSGMGVGVAAIADFSPSVYGVARLGLARTKARLGLAGFGSTSDSSSNPYYGVAIGWKMSPNLGIELGFDASKVKYKDAELEINESASTRLFSVGVNFSF